jgi:GNAT superfamily N-acetyltransferase
MPEDIRITTHIGAAILPLLDDAARLRLSVFHAWPYLYEGTREDETEYLTTYAAAPDAFLAAAHADGQIVGVSTGIPLSREPDSIQQVFRTAGIDPASVFYFGESVLAPAWRGRGLGVRFFGERERYARSLPGITMAAFCAVDRSADDPRRPPDYIPLDQFWQRRGFQRTCLQTHFTWKETGEASPSPKSLTFWTKSLAPAP